MLNTETAAGTRGKTPKARAEELVHELLAEHDGDVNEAMGAFSERAQADLGLSLLKSQGADGPYRKYYDEAKSRYLERGWTKMHSHRAAARYSEKKLLKHLWRAWQHELRGQRPFDTQLAHAPQTLPHLKDAA